MLKYANKYFDIGLHTVHRYTNLLNVLLVFAVVFYTKIDHI